MSFFFLGFALLQAINHRFWMNDFRVYYEAIHAYFNFQPVYKICFILTSGYFKYPPFALFLLYPFSLFPFDIAKIFYFVFLSLLVIVTVIFSNNIVQKKLYFINDTKPKPFLLLLISLTFIQHIYYELHLGNINILLLLFCLIALTLLQKGHPYSSGILLAFTVLIKPHFIILIPLLFLRKQFRAIISFIGTLIIGLLFPALYTGLKTNTALLTQWKDVILAHVKSPVYAQDTIYSWLYRLAGGSFSERMQPIFIISILFVIAGLILIFCINHLKKERRILTTFGHSEKNFSFEYFILIALIPSITVTDSEHFLLTLPLIAWLINYIVIRRPHIFYKVLIIISLLLYDINLHDIIGTKLSRWMTETGILGLANLLIIVVSVYLFSKERLADEQLKEVISYSDPVDTNRNRNF
jgi:hypothetical protein